ncbi:hypothetical protein EI77_01382 [Prosthecobacter fusiformis]|uniref:Uncharacterized protein n=1 Tax=Prosthecobacter fusiformis TaxID=48464 RepID=A0A4R7S5I9_9BACT|nr:hypothetical protein [Prosthecobacter fusiformis]TDU72916.1 hypothetical protein EI77_01382 [Prosthecobacter fusiformis]
MAIPTEYQIYVLATSLMAAFFVAAMVRLWLLRSVEDELLKNKAALEKQVVLQQKDLMTVRQESSAWRIEMQRQFDLFRHMASDQLSVEEKRFNDLLAKSTRREFELQAALDIAKQMCSELPSTQARVLHLESLLAAAPPPPPAPPSSNDGGLPAAPVTPMPDLGGNDTPAPTPEEEVAEAPPPPAFAMPKFFAPPPPPPPTQAAFAAPEPVVIVDEEKVMELEEKLAEAEKKNASLQVALTTTRLRSRSRPNSIRKYALKKRPLIKAMA